VLLGIASGSSTLEGDLVIQNVEDVHYYTEIRGDVNIASEFEGAFDASVQLPNLVQMRGSFVVDGVGGLTSLVVPSLQTVKGGIMVWRNPTLVKAQFQGLKVADVHIWIANNTQLTNLQFPALTTVSQYASSGYLALEGNSMLVAVSFPALMSTGLVTIYRNARLQTYNCPQLRVVGTHLWVTQNPLLENLNFPDLREVHSNLLVEHNTLLSSVDFPMLAYVGNHVLIRHNTGIQTVSLPKLTAVGDYFSIVHNDALRTVSAFVEDYDDKLPEDATTWMKYNLTPGPFTANVRGDFTIKGNRQLRSIDMSRLSCARGTNFIIIENDRLEELHYHPDVEFCYYSGCEVTICTATGCQCFAPPGRTQCP